MLKNLGASAFVPIDSINAPSHKQPEITLLHPMCRFFFGVLSLLHLRTLHSTKIDTHTMPLFCPAVHIPSSFPLPANPNTADQTGGLCIVHFSPLIATRHIGSARTNISTWVCDGKCGTLRCTSCGVGHRTPWCKKAVCDGTKIWDIEGGDSKWQLLVREVRLVTCCSAALDSVRRVN
jgi:hypothetical protein